MVEEVAEISVAPVAELIVVGSDLQAVHLGDAARKYLVSGLTKMGFRVDRISVIRDDEKSLEEMLLKCLESPHTGILIVVGGIERESGDIASRAAARITGRRLVVSDEILWHMRSVLESRGREMSPSDERLALIPQKAQILKNPAGPVCGFTLDERGKKLFFIPGRLDYMKAITSEVLFALLAQEIPRENIVFTRLFHTFGLTEERMQGMLAEAIPPAEDVEVSYSHALEEIVVRLSTKGLKGEEKLEKLTDITRDTLGDWIFAEDNGTMEETVGNQLRLKRARLATAESCTGGAIGDRITNIPGSSDYFQMGVVAYSNEAKTKLLGIQPSVIEQNGAVSSEVALLMAQGVRRLARTTFGIAVTGIAGPGGGSRQKPAGTVFIAFSSEEENRYEKYNFEGTREEVKRLTSQAALDLLRRELLKR